MISAGVMPDVKQQEIKELVGGHSNMMSGNEFQNLGPSSTIHNYPILALPSPTWTSLIGIQYLLKMMFQDFLRNL